jgi:hypothetical protein
MGNFGLFLFSEEIAQLEAFKKTLTDPTEIAEVDAKIAKLKAESEQGK